MAVPRRILDTLLVAQFILGAVVIGTVCRHTVFSLSNLAKIMDQPEPKQNITFFFAFVELIPLLISAAITSFISLFLFISIYCGIKGSQETAKPPFYLFAHGALALLLIGSSIAVLIIQVPYMNIVDLSMPNEVKDEVKTGLFRFQFAAVMGMICGVANGVNCVISKFVD